MATNEPSVGFGSGVRFNGNSSVGKSATKNMFLFVLVTLVRKFMMKAGGPYGAAAAAVTTIAAKLF